MNDSGGHVPKRRFSDVPLELHVEHFQLPAHFPIIAALGIHLLLAPVQKGSCRARAGALVKKGGGAGALLDCDQLLATCAVGSSSVARLAYELIYHEPTLAYGRSRRKAVAWDAVKPYMLCELWWATILGCRYSSKLA